MAVVQNCKAFNCRILYGRHAASSGLITRIPQTVYFTSEHIRFYFLVFLFYTRRETGVDVN